VQHVRVEKWLVYLLYLLYALQRERHKHNRTKRPRYGFSDDEWSDGSVYTSGRLHWRKTLFYAGATADSDHGFFQFRLV